MRSYNLFRLKDGDGLFCAVPESRAVPRFVDGSRWTFGGKIEDASARMVGFDGKAAATAVRFNGYYLFQSIERRWI